MNRILIDNPSDPRIEVYHGLTDEALRRRREAADGDLAGIFICEGTKVTGRALATGQVAQSVLVAEDMLDRLPDLPAHVPIYVGPPDVVESIIGFRFHRGFVAAFARRPLPDPGQILATAERIIICENVTNPTNLGTIVRSAAALGIDGLLLDPTSCDPLYRRVTRVSMGAVFNLPYARLEAFPGGLDLVANHGFRLIGLRPDAGAIPLGSVDVKGKIGLVLGAEGPGLTTDTRRRMHQIAHIPMQPGVDSLNVAAAAAISAYVIGGLDISRE